METDWGRVLSYGKYLVPRNNVWLRRMFLLFGFVLLDYFATLTFCNTPMEEANPYLRSFMENYGIFWGLTIFDFLLNLSIYLILCFNSHVINLPAQLSNQVEPIIDVILAWFLAGAHFNGATSWFWSAPNLIRQITGFSIYLFIAMILLLKFRVRQ